MNNTLSVSELARHVPDYIERVAQKGESFVIVNDDLAVAQLSPVHTGRRLGQLPALMDSLPHLSMGDADDFANDIADAHNLLSDLKVRDPWQS